MLAAMTASPESPDFGKKGGYAPQGCYGYDYGSQGYGGKGCCFGCFCGKGGYGYGQGGKGCCLCNICGCFCNALSCIFCCGKGGGYGYDGAGYGGYACGNPYMQVAQYDMEVQTQAEVIVRVPANAKLLANGQQTDLIGEQRVFRTPSLTPGHDFKYNMAIEVNVDGETKMINKQITVR